MKRRLSIAAALIKIVREGIFKTVFYIYKLDAEGHIISAMKEAISNDKLRCMRIRRPLELAEIPTELRTVART